MSRFVRIAVASLTVAVTLGFGVGAADAQGPTFHPMSGGASGCCIDFH